MDTNSSSYSVSYEYSYDLSDTFKHPLYIEIFISLFVWCISFFTLTGNILVFGAFANDPQLRDKVGNLFILNLASADLIVGINSLTFNNLWRYYGNWPFGEGICKLWMIFDYAATMQSTFAIVLISMDRYLMVTMELKYRTFMTRCKACSSIAFTWSSSLMFFAVPILGYELWDPKPWIPHFDITCDNGVLYIMSYNIATLLYAFVFPGGLLVFFNIKVFHNIHKRAGGLVRSRKIAPESLSVHSVADPLQETSRDRHAGQYQTRDAGAQQEVAIQQVAHEKRRELRKDKKAAATLAMIVIVYVICWLPYYITQLIYTYHERQLYISWTVWNGVYYLTWLNSALNPCLYAIASPKMRKNFLELICFWKKCHRQ
ncbi:histamine H3 receptor-like [Amphiura filiformis]|uniref:histamine H3 receptor-like n=1 Tax=Amphiura filiformis TaxID=82378 RepID=UPI003B21E3F6